MNAKIKYWLTIMWGLIVIVFGVHFFMTPNHLVAGSITGLAVVLVKIIPIQLSMMTLILNVICIILAFVFIDKAFGKKIIAISILLPMVMFVFETIFPNPESITGSVALDAVGMCTVITYGQAILFNANAASGGLDIIAKIISKYLHVDLGAALIIGGGVAVGSAFFVYDVQTVVVGLMITYFSGLMLDYFIEGFTGKVRVCVISDSNEDFRKFIVEHLQRGVTMYTAMGGYTGEPQSELCAILTKKEYGLFMEHLQLVDPKAFVTISGVKRVVGSWNSPTRRGSYF